MRYRDLNSDIPSCISKFHIQDGHEPKCGGELGQLGHRQVSDSEV